MYVVVHHRISNPEQFWSLVQQATPNLPESLTIHHCLPKADGSEALCVWEGPSLREVRETVESAVGESSRNEYFEAEAKEGINLPSGPIGAPPASPGRIEEINPGGDSIMIKRTRATLWTAALLIAGFAVTLLPEPADSQIPRRIQRAAERAAERALEREDEQEAEAAAEEADPAAAPGTGVWVNYDFVPGERVIFAEDFSRDNVGDFPRRMEFRRGNMEVAEWQGQRWLRATTNSQFAIDLPETLPQRFTVELDFAGTGNAIGWLYFSGEMRGQHVRFSSSGGGVQGGNVSAQGRFDGGPADEPKTLRVMADGRYVKVYLNETRVANVPSADLGRTDQIIVRLQASDRNPLLLNDFRIAAGGRTLYDALSADGRVATRGILFDTGSDRIRPESTPTLKEIGEMLRQHGDLRLRIEGHTDSVGDAATNQALSERRAASVRQFLIHNHGIDAGRLEAAGLGQTQPADSNDTPEGRQNNRRVELVRL